MAIVQIDEAELEKIIAREVTRQLQAYLDKLEKSQRFTPPKTWPKDFFERTAGSFADTNLERPPQAIFLAESMTI